MVNINNSYNAAGNSGNWPKELKFAKSNSSIKLDNLTGVNTKKYAELIKFLENNQNIVIDKDGNGIIEGDETSIFQKALVNMAGTDGVINKKDFDKASRDYYLSQCYNLANDTTNNKVTFKENGDYTRVYANGTIISGKENGNSYIMNLGTKKFQDGSEISYNHDGKERGGKTQAGEEYITTTIDGLKIRQFNKTGVKIYYDNSGEELYRSDSGGEHYQYIPKNDGNYEKNTSIAVKLLCLIQKIKL